MVASATFLYTLPGGEAELTALMFSTVISFFAFRKFLFLHKAQEDLYRIRILRFAFIIYLLIEISTVFKKNTRLMHIVPIPIPGTRTTVVPVPAKY